MKEKAFRFIARIGKCLLAWQPEAVQKSIIEELVWEQMTPTTITHPQRLYEELARIRRQGWSYDNGEDYADVRCVAAPVFNANNELTAAISVVGTRLQINEEYRDYLAGKAIACARIFHVCWDGKVPLTYRPHNNGEHHDPTKNQTGSRLVYWRCDSRKGAGGGDYHDQGRITGLMIILPPR